MGQGFSHAKIYKAFGIIFYLGIKGKEGNWTLKSCLEQLAIVLTYQCKLFLKFKVNNYKY